MPQEHKLFALVLGGGSPRATVAIPEEVKVDLERREWRWRGYLCQIGVVQEPPVDGYILGIDDAARVEDVVEMVRNAAAHVGRLIPLDEEEDGD